MSEAREEFLQINVNGQRLAASFHRPTRDEPFPVVVCCHGLTGTRVGSSYRLVRLGRRLARAGIGCFRFDFRGCGESEGEFLAVTAASVLEDLRAVLGWLNVAISADWSRIGIAASSFGAYTASRVVGELPGFRCAVFLAPVADPQALIARDIPERAWELIRRQGWVEHHGLPLSRAFLETLPTDDVPRQFSRSARPLLIYHGSADAQVPIDQGRMFEQAMRDAGGPVELRVLDTSDHGMRGVANTDAIISGATDWFMKYLM